MPTVRSLHVVYLDECLGDSFVAVLRASDPELGPGTAPRHHPPKRTLFRLFRYRKMRLFRPILLIRYRFFAKRGILTLFRLFKQEFALRLWSFHEG